MWSEFPEKIQNTYWFAIQRITWLIVLVICSCEISFSYAKECSFKKSLAVVYVQKKCCRWGGVRVGA